MRKKIFTSPLALVLTTIILLSCKSNSTGQDNNGLSNDAVTKQSETDKKQSATIAVKNETSVSIDCEALGLKELVQDACGFSSVLEKNNMEIKGRNCTRSYTTADKQWGEKLIILITSSASSFDWMKKEYAPNGMKEITGVGEDAFTLEFPDKLNGRKNIQLVFRKGDKLIELKTMESPDPKSQCPCYGVEKLKVLALKIADKL